MWARFAAAAAYDIAARAEWGAQAALNFPFPGERSARPGIEPQEWTLPTVSLAPRSGPRVTNTSGFTGASLVKATGKWAASIKINGKSRNLGMYDTAEEAAAAYQEAKRRKHRTGPARSVASQLRLI